MSWTPTDLVADADLQDYENTILTQYGQTDWASKRIKALEDWLFPILRMRGFDPYRLRVRTDPSFVWSVTSTIYTDRTAAAISTTEGDLNLATIWATPSTDVIYVGATRPFRGLYWRLTDAVATTVGTTAVTYWNGAWQSLAISDGTMRTDKQTFSGGGSMTWTLPLDWAPRSISSAPVLYWARVAVSAVRTATTATQLAVIQSSALRAPATFRTLALIFQEAPTGQEGPWRDKANFYLQQADESLQRSMSYVAEEFDTDLSEQGSATEHGQTATDIGATVAILERR